MGLDQYLCDAQGNEIVYWRKRNHFHKFFCENGKETKETEHYYGPYIISRGLLNLLLDKIDIILSSKLDKPILKSFNNGCSWKDGVMTERTFEAEIEYDEELARNLLPSQKGFFFGSTDYNPYYYESLIRTKEILSEYLKTNPRARKFIYTSSW